MFQMRHLRLIVSKAFVVVFLRRLLVCMTEVAKLLKWQTFTESPSLPVILLKKVSLSSKAPQEVEHVYSTHNPLMGTSLSSLLPPIPGNFQYLLCQPSASTETTIKSWPFSRCNVFSKSHFHTSCKFFINFSSCHTSPRSWVWARSTIMCITHWSHHILLITNGSWCVVVQRYCIKHASSVCTGKSKWIHYWTGSRLLWLMWHESWFLLSSWLSLSDDRRQSQLHHQR